MQNKFNYYFLLIFIFLFFKVLATGSVDGKIKLWDTKSFLCFATFSEHASKVTGLKFVQNNQNTLISCSLDGTCRAFDSLRYRNFRTMTPNVNAQLNCLAVDPMGDVFILLKLLNY